MKDLTGKKRYIIDSNVFLDLARNQAGQITSNQYYSNLYLPYENVDTLRVALGKTWDYEFNQNNLESDIFSNNNTPLNVFCDSHLEMDDCKNPIMDFDQIPFEADSYSQMRQRLVLKASPSTEDVKNSFGFVGLEDPAEDLVDNFFWAYLMKYGVITEDGNSYDPIIKTNQDYFDHYHTAFAPYTLKELEQQQPAGKAFYVNYKTFYNGRSPYAVSQVADSLYNNADFMSKNSILGYENFISNPDYQNCLPNVYSFLKIAENSNISDQSIFNISEIVDGGEDGVNSLNPGITMKDHYFVGFSAPVSEEISFIRNDAYKTLLQSYPFETNLLLYGALSGESWVGAQPGASPAKWPGTDVQIEQIINNNQKITDLGSLIRQWHNSFQDALNRDLRFSAYPVVAAGSIQRYGLEPYSKLGSLEYVGSNIIFSPHAIKKYSAPVDQYKNYFPMYFEIDFSTRILTQIGDMVQEYKLGKFLGQQLAAIQDPYGIYASSRNESYFDKFKQDTSTDYSFVDFIERLLYTNPQTGESLSLPSEGQAYTTNTKKTINLISLIDDYIANEDYSSANIQENYWPYYNDITIVPSDPPEPSWAEDVRNYTSYLIDDTKENVADESSCNPIYKTLFGPLFRQKLLDVYEEHKRSYLDIINGVPAYTEDLFYIIKKFRKSDGDIEEVNIQNIIIPNTSELNVAKYVDTQVKYGSHATFRYEVHAARVVFGSRYKYFYRGATTYNGGGGVGIAEVPGAKLEDLELVNAKGQIDGLVNGIILQDLDSSWSAGLTVLQNPPSYTATVDVDIYPSIQLIQDMIFSTEDIKIYDDPPIPPFINIFPYRAVNNRIGIILSGQSDSYRDTPISMLEGDEDSYEEILKSQFSVDGKIRFSSDDQVSGYQIFRTDTKPVSYADFSLHPDIPEVYGASTGINDLILPNKKYYYTFRTIDVHGHFSNPSPVYEVELIDEKGAVKPIIRTIDMGLKQNKDMKKECQKYLMVKPSLKQLYLSDDESVDNIFSAKDSTNKKRFKIRLTSKSTGKKIDMNFSFVKNFTDE